MICKICGNFDYNKTFTVKEMMFGTGDEFYYIECNKCGCLQIENVPSDMNKYYPSNFYSFNDTTDKGIKNYLRKKRNKYAFFKKGIIGKFMFERYPTYFFDKLVKLDIRLESRILDVGCG